MPENKAIQTADQIISAAIYAAAKPAALTYLQVAFPFLKLPIISGIASFIIGKVADALYAVLENFTAFKIIDAQVGAQVDTYKEAVENLKKTVSTGGDTDEATKKYKQALHDLIHYNGHD